MLLNRLFTFSIFHSPLAYSRVKLKLQRLYHCLKMEIHRTSLTIVKEYIVLLYILCYRPISLLSHFSKILESIYSTSDYNNP